MTRVRLFVLLACLATAGVVLTLVAGAFSDAPHTRGISAQAAATRRIDDLLAGIPQHANVLGDPRAPITLEFFGDLQCPTSRQFTLGALPFIIRKWVRNGTLRIEYRSLDAATREPEVFKLQQVAALAAGLQNRLWYYIELFYHQQSLENSGYVTEAYLQSLAHQTPGLNLELWREDRKDPVLAGEVEEDGMAARATRMRTTPAFLIGLTGRPHATRIVSFSLLEPTAFDEAVESLLTP